MVNSEYVDLQIIGMWYVVCGMWYVVCGMWFSFRALPYMLFLYIVVISLQYPCFFKGLVLCWGNSPGLVLLTLTLEAVPLLTEFLLPIRLPSYKD